MSAFNSIGSVVSECWVLLKLPCVALLMQLRPRLLVCKTTVAASLRWCIFANYALHYLSRVTQNKTRKSNSVAPTSLKSAAFCVNLWTYSPALPVTCIWRSSRNETDCISTHTLYETIVLFPPIIFVTLRYLKQTLTDADKHRDLPIV